MNRNDMRSLPRGMDGERRDEERGGRGGMCDLCLRFPCRTGCPNREAPEVRVCDLCGEPILRGDRMLRLPGLFVCEACGALPCREIWPEIGGWEEDAHPPLCDEED